MYCVRCKLHVVECGCEDIEERLRSLCSPSHAPGAVAAAANLRARVLARNLSRRDGWVFN